MHEGRKSARERRRSVAGLQDEVDLASLYRVLAEVEAQPALADVYRRLAAAEERHSVAWKARFAAAGQPAPELRPSWRARTLAWLARRFGPEWVLPAIAAREQQSAGSGPGGMLGAESRSHSRLVRAMIDASPAGLGGDVVARFEGRHRAMGGNALRAAVLGANDGLVSNLSLVMGVAGADVQGRLLLLTGLAGLLAGACSMAMGEWLSVQSSRELYQRQIQVEQEELAEAPEEEAEELALIYQARGMPEAQARSLAQTLISDDGQALDALSREELGIDPQELGGSAWEAAGTSFVLFCIGAIVPAAPFFWLSGPTAVITSLTVSAVSLFLIGAAITLLTGRSVLYSGCRQLLFGLGAAGVTYAIGRLAGVTLAG